MHTHKIAPVVVTHSFNGNVDDSVKFVEVDGKKFVDDGSGKAKVGDDGKPVPFLEKALDPSTADLTELAKVNPVLAKFLSEKADLDKKLSDFNKTQEEEKRKAAEKNGDWQKLADEERVKREKFEADLMTTSGQLEKYKGTIESILKTVMATIPREKHSLIPADFSPRQKLEYITVNAPLLGAKIVGANGKQPDSDTTVTVTDEEKLVKEVEVLLAKKPRTPQEDALLSQKATALKKLRSEKGKQ